MEICIYLDSIDSCPYAKTDVVPCTAIAKSILAMFHHDHCDSSEYAAKQSIDLYRISWDPMFHIECAWGSIFEILNFS